MRNTWLMSLATVAVVLLGVCREGNTNGINPPHPRNTTTIIATCIQAEDDKTLDIHRARLVRGEQDVKAFVFKVNSVEENISVSDVKKIKITGNTDSDGYVNAKITRANGAEEVSGKVRMRQSGESLALKGFKNNTRKRVSVSMDRCKQISFSLKTTLTKNRHTAKD